MSEILGFREFVVADIKEDIWSRIAFLQEERAKEFKKAYEQYVKKHNDWVNEPIFFFFKKKDYRIIELKDNYPFALSNKTDNIPEEFVSNIEYITKTILDTNGLLEAISKIRSLDEFVSFHSETEKELMVLLTMCEKLGSDTIFLSDKAIKTIYG